MQFCWKKIHNYNPISKRSVVPAPEKLEIIGWDFCTHTQTHTQMHTHRVSFISYYSHWPKVAGASGVGTMCGEKALVLDGNRWNHTVGMV